MRRATEFGSVTDMNTWTSLSNEIASAVEKAAPSIVQVHGRDRVSGGVVVAKDIVATPAATDEETVAVLADGKTLEGVVLGEAAEFGMTVLRVEGLNHPALAKAPEPKVGNLGVAIGRTWSGGIMAMLAPIAVVGGPLRTGRGTSIERVIRIQQSPHGALNGGALIDASGAALGLVSSVAIRGTTVVVPAAIAWAAAEKVVAEGGAKQGYLGLGTLPVPLPERQRAGRTQESGLLISAIAADSPAEAGGLMVGDVIVAFGGETVETSEDLLTKLRGHKVGAKVPITVIRGAKTADVTVTIGERPRTRG
jgi:S1-C subfamily serine protease